MWRIWFFFGILEIGFGAPVKTNQDGAPSSELVVLKCLLSSPLNTCDDVKRTVEKIPKRIQKLYEKLKRPLRDIATNEILDTDALDTIPISLLYLIPKIRLHSVSGQSASSVVRKFPLDDALTMKVLGLLSDDTKIQDFLNGLSKYDFTVLKSDYDAYEDDDPFVDVPFISPAVEEEIGGALSKWFPNGTHWEFWLFKAAMMSGTPLLANLPNHFLKSLPLITTEKFLYHLRNWRWDLIYPTINEDGSLPTPSSSVSLWSRHTMSVRRIWAHVVLTKAEEPGRWSSRILKQLGFLLTGATPDELRRLPQTLRQSHNFQILVDLDWSPLQSRSVFDVLYSDLSDLGGSDLLNLRNMVGSLLPRQLQQFDVNGTNFAAVMKSDERMSLVTKKQIFEMQLTHKVMKKYVSGLSPTHWRERITSLGKFIHVVPSSQLREFADHKFDLETLGKIDSTYFSYRQARYLTKSGDAIDFSPPKEESVLSVHSLLKSVPSVKLAVIDSNRLAQNVKEHLLMFTPGVSLASTSALLQKIRPNFADISLLEKMLYNKDYIQYFNLLSSRDITRQFKDVSSNLFVLVNKDANLEKNIRLLPYNTLTALLSHHRRELVSRGEEWTYENLIDSPFKMFISGLSCPDIQHLEISDFMPVIGYYVRHRRALGQVFPKNMQYCSQIGLVRYLKMKAQLRGIRYDTNGLLHLLEPYEVKAVGGYILAGFPSDILISHPRKQQIISEIGKLSVSELLTASSVHHIKRLANSYYERPLRYNLKTINALGNLVWFLRGDNIQWLDVSDFKLFMESQEEDAKRALCLDEEEREAWSQFLKLVYGNPTTWSSGTLKEMGDLLYVFENRDLGSVNRTSWTEAADVLARSTSFFDIMEWPGKTKPVHVYDVCLSVLNRDERPSYKTAVKNLLRFYLESAQLSLNTVIPAERLLENGRVPANEALMGKLHFAPNLLSNHNRNASLPPAVDSQDIASANGSIVPNVTEQTVVVAIDMVNCTATSAHCSNKTDTYKIESKEAGDAEEDKNFSDIVQGDQEAGEDDEEEEEDDYDYDYDADYPSDNGNGYNNKNEHVDLVQDHLNPVNDGKETLTEAEASERLKRLLMSPLHFFNIFNNKEENEVSSSQTGAEHTKRMRRRRSINDAEMKEKMIYRSPDDVKSLEERKEELRVSGSRDLVIEVPQSSTEKLGFGNPLKRATRITCDAIRILDKPASLVLERDDIAAMSDVELEDCAEVLGSLELEHDLRREIWKRLKEWKSGGNLLEVGNLVAVIEEDELSDIKLQLSEPWGYENLNALSKYITDPFLMSHASDEFLIKNSNLSALSYEAASALGPLICTMTLSHQKKLLLTQPHVFVNTVPILGSTIECSNKIFESCIYQLAKIATTSEAFGRTWDWDANDVASLGVIAAGLSKEDWYNGERTGLQPEALAGLTPSAVSCMSPEAMRVLTEEQLSHIPPLAAAAVTESQLSSLSPSQLAVLERVRRQVTPSELELSISGAASAKTGVAATIYISVTVYFTWNYFITRTF